MDDPRLLPPPDDFLGRVRALARDLAYGFEQGEFPSRYSVIYYTDNREDLDTIGLEYGLKQSFKEFLNRKWQNIRPKMDALWVLGYVTAINYPENDVNQYAYMLTEKALALLEEPATPPTIFISYKRSESAALGLLTVARLKMAGVPNPFIDMELQPGDLWHAQLEQYVKESQYLFFCLLVQH